MPPSGPTEATALFLPDGDRYVPTVYTQGPWAPHLQFGGAPAALMATVVEETPSLVPQQIARLTIDLLRPVPVRPLTVERRIVREGKRIQVVEVRLEHEGLEVARCTALRMRQGDLGQAELPSGGVPLPLAEATMDGSPLLFADRDRDVPGSSRAAEFRVPPGSPGPFRQPTWIRLCVPVVAGQDTYPVAGMAFISDFASGVGHPRDVVLSGINADITLHIVRPPVDAWLCMDGTGWTSRSGVGQVHATLSDAEGVVAGLSMSRLVDLPVG